METKPFSELNDNLCIYRVIPLDVVYTMLLSNNNVLLQPALWDDPYEKLLMKSTFSIGDATNKIVGKLKWQNWLGQCWSCTEESDGIWRSYTQSKLKRSVKIKTTVGKLRNAYSKSELYEMFIYKVAYTSKDVHSYNETLQQWIDFLIKEGDNNKEISKKIELAFLLTKRNAFEYENEVRLLQHLTFETFPVTNAVSQIGVNDMDWIDEFEIDPWAVQYEKNDITANLKELGVDKDKIKVSKLYTEVDTSEYQFHISIKT